MKTHFLIIVSLSVFHMGQTMPQNRNNPNNRPGSRDNPVGGFRPLTSANDNRNEAGKWSCFENELYRNVARQVMLKVLVCGFWQTLDQISAIEDWGGFRT